jgi:hypothetical protein
MIASDMPFEGHKTVKLSFRQSSRFRKVCFESNNSRSHFNIWLVF